jgi:hypothetical protein
VFFENLEQIVTSGGIKGLETPVVEDEQLHAAERPLDAGIATIAGGEREVGEQLGNALVENGAIVAAQRLANSCRHLSARTGSSSHGRRSRHPPQAFGITHDRVRARRGNDIFDGGLMAQPGVAQAGAQPPVASVARVLVEHQCEPFGMGQRRGFTGCFDPTEGLGHAGKSELTQEIEVGLGEQGIISYW